MTREGNNPTRRIVRSGLLSESMLSELSQRIQYVGSAHHKLRPGDYDFHPPVNPRAAKSVCDDLRSILLAEASKLFKLGITSGLVSQFEGSENPKYVWCVDESGQVYEAKKSDSVPNTYHGYRLDEDDEMHRLILKEWKQRCP